MDVIETLNFLGVDYGSESTMYVWKVPSEEQGLSVSVSIPLPCGVYVGLSYTGMDNNCFVFYDEASDTATYILGTDVTNATDNGYNVRKATIIQQCISTGEVTFASIPSGTWKGYTTYPNDSPCKEGDAIYLIYEQNEDGGWDYWYSNNRSGYPDELTDMEELDHWSEAVKKYMRIDLGEYSPKLKGGTVTPEEMEEIKKAWEKQQRIMKAKWLRICPII